MLTNGERRRVPISVVGFCSIIGDRSNSVSNDTLVREPAMSEAKIQRCVKVTPLALFITLLSLPLVARPELGLESEEIYVSEHLQTTEQRPSQSLTEPHLRTHGSRKTPWGGLTVANGDTVPDQPYFTGGVYTYIQVVKLHRCKDGKWQ
jgi:hypothetical protein